MGFARARIVERARGRDEPNEWRRPEGGATPAPGLAWSCVLALGVRCRGTGGRGGVVRGTTLPARTGWLGATGEQVVVVRHHARLHAAARVGVLRPKRGVPLVTLGRDLEPP